LKKRNPPRSDVFRSRQTLQAASRSASLTRVRTVFAEVVDASGLQARQQDAQGHESSQAGYIFGVPPPRSHPCEGLHGAPPGADSPAASRARAAGPQRLYLHRVGPDGTAAYRAHLTAFGRVASAGRTALAAGPLFRGGGPQGPSSPLAAGPSQFDTSLRYSRATKQKIAPQTACEPQGPSSPQESRRKIAAPVKLANNEGPTARSPSSLVIPVLVYPDVREAVEWLAAAFGFVEHVQIGEGPPGRSSASAAAR